jgi:hypothetical protein
MDSATYQELIRRAAHDVDLASYVLLLEACQKVLEGVPGTMGELEALDPKEVLSSSLAQLGETITRIVPYQEFYFYTPESWPQARLLKNTIEEEKWKREHVHG